ncbi:methionyl-tRNA formyltransferase [uncultured bacterium]|nr:methionyl-tRNA formyltransferase [uncultured bacterium]
MPSVVVMGTPQFCVPVLKGLVDKKYQVKALVTQPDEPVGRKHRLTPPPAKVAAQKLGIPVLQPKKLGGSPEMAKVMQMKPDFIVTAAYGQFLPTKLLKSAKVGAINVHGSLLPKYRGGAPIQRAIMNGDQETGVTIMYMVKKMDAGNIIAQKPLPITPVDDAGSIFRKLSLVGRDLLLETMPKLVNHTAKSIPQDSKQVVFAPVIKHSETKLDFSKSAKAIDCHVRGLRPDPGAYMMMDKKRVKVWKTTPLDQDTKYPAGTIAIKTKHQLAIATGDHKMIAIDELQPAGKSKQKITDYLNGAGQKLKVGEQVIK